MNKIKVLISIFLILSIGSCTLVRLKNSNVEYNGECKSGYYYSDYTMKCQESRLLFGAGSQVKSYSLKKLKKKFRSTQLIIKENPAYKSLKRDQIERNYEGFDLKEFLESQLSGKEKLSDYVVSITTLDGFDPIIEQDILENLESSKAILAFGQKNITGLTKKEITKDEQWEIVSAPWGLASPAPFYLVWEKADGTYWKGWPFQVKSIRLVKKEQHDNLMSQIKPDNNFMDKSPKTLIEVGYNSFKGKCLTCHSINKAGGKKARVNLVNRMKSLSEEQAASLIQYTMQNPPIGMRDVLDLKFEKNEYLAISKYIKSFSVK